MRAGFFLFLLCALLAFATARIQPPANERAHTFSAFAPSLKVIAQYLPPHATIGLLGVHIQDAELLHEIRWMLFPRTVERILADRPWEQDTLLLISNVHGQDTVSPRILSHSRLLLSLRDSDCSYQLMIPEKERR